MKSRKFRVGRVRHVPHHHEGPADYLDKSRRLTGPLPGVSRHNGHRLPLKPHMTVRQHRLVLDHVLHHVDRQILCRKYQHVRRQRREIQLLQNPVADGRAHQSQLQHPFLPVISRVQCPPRSLVHSLAPSQAQAHIVFRHLDPLPPGGPLPAIFLQLSAGAPFRRPALRPSPRRCSISKKKKFSAKSHVPGLIAGRMKLFTKNFPAPASPAGLYFFTHHRML